MRHRNQEPVVVGMYLIILSAVITAAILASFIPYRWEMISPGAVDHRGVPNMGLAPMVELWRTN